eukprot:656383_1
MLTAMLSLLTLGNLLFSPSVSQSRALLNTDANTIVTKKAKHANYRSSVEGVYKGSYSGAHEDGSCLLLINHLETISSSDPKQANQSESIIISASLCKSRLLILNTDYERHAFQFWYGFYSAMDGQMILSDHNFTYNARHSNVSFADNGNATCPQLLHLWIGSSDDAIFGNFTDNCAYDIDLLRHSFSFDLLSVLSHRANSYGMMSLCCVSGMFYFLFKQFEYSQVMGRVVKVSFITLYLQFIYNGMIGFIHFDAAMNVELLFSTFLMITFICIMNANLYQRMMRSIWCLRYPTHEPLNRLKLLNFVQILAFIFILFVSQYLMVGSGSSSYLIFAILTSDWLAQCVHNIKTGHIMSWKMSAVVAHTACKLFFPLYIYGCPHNIAHHDTNYLFCVCLVAWQCAQIFALYWMDCKRNARVFLPHSMRPQQYKYHTINSEDIDDEDIDEEQYKQCSICLENINWKKEYKSIMVTPCNHYFHDNCLTQWMVQRLTCPTCRANIPPSY